MEVLRPWHPPRLPSGIRKYTKVQSLLVTKLAPKKDIHMFPYKKGRTRALQRLYKFLYGRGKRD